MSLYSERHLKYSFSYSGVSNELTQMGQGSLAVLGFHSFKSSTVASPSSLRVSGFSASSISNSESSYSLTMIWLEVTSSYSSPLLVSELPCWPIKTTVHLFTLSEPSIFTSRIENCCMWDSIELCTSFWSLSQLNIESFGSYGSEFDDSLPFMILLNTDDFGCAWYFTL